MANPLILRFATDTQTARRGIEQLASTVATNMGNVATAMRLASSTSLTSVNVIGRAATAAAGLLAVYAGYRIAAAAIGQASEALDRYVKLAEDASKAGVSVEFFQRFVSGAKDAKEEVEGLEKALQHAVDAAKERFGEDNAVRARLAAIFESGFTGQFQSQGLKLFDAAEDAESRIRAVLVAMKELQDLGLQLAAVDIGERMFGKDFAEQVRRNASVIDETLQKLDQKRDDIISEQTVNNAKELRERIENAKREIDEVLGISVNLERSGMALLGTWASILEKVAGVAKAADDFLKKILAAGPATQSLSQAVTTTLRDQEASIQRRLEAERRDPYPRKAIISGLEGQLRDVQGRLLLRDPEAFPLAPGADVTPAAPKNVPLPPRRDFSLFNQKDKKEKPEAAESLDQIETFISQLEKQNDLLRVEFENLGKSNVEREKGIALARLHAAARAAQREPTEEETKAVLRQAEANGRLKDSIESVRKAQQDLNQAMTFFGDIAADTIGDLLDGTFKAEDALKRLRNALLQAAFTGQGPLAGILGMSGKNGDAGGLAGIVGSLFKGGGGSNFLGELVGFDPFAGMHGGGVVGRDASFVRHLPAAAFAGARRRHGGGSVGGRPWFGPGEVPIIAQEGEIILNLAQQRNVARGLTASPAAQRVEMIFAPVIHAEGADAAALARVQEQLLTLNRTLEARAIGAVIEARMRSVGV